MNSVELSMNTKINPKPLTPIILLIPVPEGCLRAGPTHFGWLTTYFLREYFMKAFLLKGIQIGSGVPFNFGNAIGLEFTSRDPLPALRLIRRCITDLMLEKLAILGYHCTAEHVFRQTHPKGPDLISEWMAKIGEDAILASAETSIAALKEISALPRRKIV